MRPILEMAAATHAGLVRSHNEDAIAMDVESGFAVLADGMGGYNAGEVASRIAVDLVSSKIHSALAQKQSLRLDQAAAERLIANHIAEANHAVYEASRAHAEYSGMGTTLVVALWYDELVAVGHVGDSRLYRLRDGSLTQLTRDHSLMQQQIDRGVLSPAQARHSVDRHIVTRAVGIELEIETDVRSIPSLAGDLYILCSDGLTDMLSDREIERTLTSLGPRLQRAADELVQQANASGGLDNISVILARVSYSAADMQS